ncbi:MAG: metallophosphoesterase [Kiritimatiellae bacterium]|nr:metallophosphoesterase [Kiritimatiellia bacterium]
MRQNGLTRRWFIGGMAGAAATMGTRRLFAMADAAKAPGAKLKMGVLSDIHLNREGDEDTFLNALSYFRDAGADAVLIAGDIADTGRIVQLKRCADCWFKIFPNGKAPDGRTVEQLFIYGNHCVTAWTWGNPYKDNEAGAAAEAIGYRENRARIWDEFFHEPYQPIWLKRVKGFPVIGAHWEERGKGIDIEEFMKAHAKEIDPALPFFYTQHAHPKDTCFGRWSWGHDDGRSTRALSPYPNAIALSGHSHYSLTDERTVWQGAFTSINTSSLRYTSLDFALRENSNGNNYGYKAKKRERAMRSLGTGDGRQGMLLSVFDDHVVIERREFLGNQSLGDDWVFPLPCADPKPFAYVERAKRRTAPQFPAGAEVKIALTKDKKERQLVEITFPAAEAKQKCRVFEYEVTAVLVEDDVDLIQLQRRVIAPDFHLPEKSAGKPGICVLFADDLPNKGHYRFDVRPIECFGHKGEPIHGTAVI